jgi:di/tricarboxylate transporter
MPTIPNAHAGAVMALTVFALILFTRPKIPLASSSLVVLVALCLGFELFPFYQVNGAALTAYDFFQGFGHEALIAVCALMVVGQGLSSTGALVPMGRIIARAWRTSPTFSLLLTLFLGAVGSAFLNNTPIVVLLIPILLNVAHRNNSSAASILMPMNFATLLGGTCTTIGTSTNLLVVGVAVDLGLREFGMFDFVKPAAIAGAIGLLYLWLVVPFIFRHNKKSTEPEEEVTFTSQLQFPPESPSIGKTIADLQEMTDGKLKIVKLRRARQNYGSTGTVPLPDAVIEENDRITIQSTMEEISEQKELLKAETFARSPDDEPEPEEEEIHLAQIVLMENSRYVNNTLARTRFADMHGLKIIGIHRAGRPIKSLPEGVGEVTLWPGDVLLAEGTDESIEALDSVASLMVLGDRKIVPMTKKGPYAIAILLAVVLAAALNIVPIATSALVGVMLMLATRSLYWKDVQSALSIPVIMIVVASLALGLALSSTGATQYIAEVFLYLLDGLSAAAVLSGLILLMAILTNIVSNNAAAVIGTPIAVSIATQLNVPVEAFVLAVIFGANLSFATPIAYKTNVLVMSAANYNFLDFVKAGLPLTILMWATYSVLLPRLYGF